MIQVNYTGKKVTKCVLFLRGVPTHGSPSPHFEVPACGWQALRHAGVVPPHASSGGTLRSTPYHAPLELRRVPSTQSPTVLKTLSCTPKHATAYMRARTLKRFPCLRVTASPPQSRGHCSLFSLFLILRIQVPPLSIANDRYAFGSSRTGPPGVPVGGPTSSPETNK
jgi:hypothetical protein